MSADAAAAIALTTAGGLCEVLGLIIVAREIRSDRQRAERFLERLDQPQRPKRSYPARVSAGMMPPEYAMPGFAPSMHLSGVIDDLQKTKADVANALIGMKKAVDAELDTAVEAIQSDVAERDGELRDGLRYVLAGSVRERWNGVKLLGLGIVLGTLGSVIGNLP